jgi:hypothetical protein
MASKDHAESNDSTTPVESSSHDDKDIVTRDNSAPSPNETPTSTLSHKAADEATISADDVSTNVNTKTDPDVGANAGDAVNAGADMGTVSSTGVGSSSRVSSSGGPVPAPAPIPVSEGVGSSSGVDVDGGVSSIVKDVNDDDATSMANSSFIGIDIGNTNDINIGPGATTLTTDTNLVGGTIAFETDNTSDKELINLLVHKVNTYADQIHRERRRYDELSDTMGMKLAQSQVITTESTKTTAAHIAKSSKYKKDLKSALDTVTKLDYQCNMYKNQEEWEREHRIKAELRADEAEEEIKKLKKLFEQE